MGLDPDAGALPFWVKYDPLREDPGAGLMERAAVVACGAAMLTLAPVAARQLGLLRRLPDPPGEVWASDEIVMSEMAHPKGIPDGLLGMGSYAVTLALLLLTQRTEAVRPVLRAKLALDAAAAGANTVRQFATFGKACSWCLGTVACTVAMVTLGWPGPSQR